MDSKSYYDLQILNQVEEAPRLTNRLAAEKLGVSVKLTHSILKGLIKRGHIHAKQRDGRSRYYLLTPAGIAEKIRLTYEFMNFTTQFFREARRRSSEVCQKLMLAGVKRVAFLGCGELAEISYLGIKEHGLLLTAVFDDDKNKETFMGTVVKKHQDLLRERSTTARDRFEKILVASYDPKHPGTRHYLPEGVVADERFVWVFDHDDMVEEIKLKAPKGLE
jgi:DNA-binding MarR family transcriptional regulator